MFQKNPRAFRCVACGAFWDRHWVSCARCWVHGNILPWSERLYSAIDDEPGFATAREIAGMSFGTVESSAFPALKLGKRSMVVVYGDAGAGKSSMGCRLANGVRGPVLYVAAEEGIGPALNARFDRCKIRREDFCVVTKARVTKAVSYLRQLGAASLVCDSVQEASWRSDELRHILEVCPKLEVLVAVAQVNKAGVPSGTNALVHEADVVISVSAMRWRITKSRYQPLDGVEHEVLPSHVREDAA